MHEETVYQKTVSEKTKIIKKASEPKQTKRCHKNETVQHVQGDMSSHSVSTAQSDSYLHCHPKNKKRKTKHTYHEIIDKGASTKFSETLARNSNLQPLNTARLMRIQEHWVLNGKQTVAVNVPGDGNCFFHCLSLALHGNDKFVLLYRRLITRHIVDHWDQYKELAELCHDQVFPSEYHFWEFMSHTNSWATASEIKAACTIFRVHIVTFLQGSRFNEALQETETSYLNVSYFSDNPSNRTLYLLLQNNHFQLLLEKKDDSSLNSGPTTINDGKAVASNSISALREEAPLSCTSTGANTRTFPSDNTVNATSKHRSYSVKNNSTYNSHSSVTNQPTYIPEEEDTFIKCRKLGIAYDFTPENETLKDTQSRKKRNLRKIKAGEKKYGVDINSLPNPPPIHEDNHFNLATDAIRAFELSQNSLAFKYCNICKERRINMAMGTDTICRGCFRDKNTVKMFSVENKMDPGPVPNELKDLSITEQQLICRVSPAIHIHMLKHGGISSSGHCVTFPQQVNEPAQILPNLPSEINIIKVQKKGRNDSSKQFRVRRYQVQYALQWLKLNNPAYSDILISQERLENLPIDSDIDLPTLDVNEVSTSNDMGPAHEQTDPGEIASDTESGVLLPEPAVNIREQVENVVKNVIGPAHGPVTESRNVVTIPWPSRDDTPVSEFTTMHFFSLAFPCLFPNSSGDFYINRPRTCSSLSDWTDHLIWYDDGRFAQHPNFQFIAHNMIMRKRTLEQSTYIVQQQLGDKHLSVCDIKEQIKKW